MSIVLMIFLYYYTKSQILCRITFKIDDVPAHLIKQTVGLRWAGMWVKEPWERM